MQFNSTEFNPIQRNSILGKRFVNFYITSKMHKRSVLTKKTKASMLIKIQFTTNTF